MFNPTPNFDSRLTGASKEAKELLSELLIDAILNSSIPEEYKIEVRIVQAYRELDTALEQAFLGFVCPIPPTEEGEEIIKRIYPARQAFLEYLKLMKGGLENFLVNVPVPDIPPRVSRSCQETA